MDSSFEQPHSKLALPHLWWWSSISAVMALALVANIVVVMTVIYNRRLKELRTVANALMVAVATLDLLDLARIVPVLVKRAYDDEIFRHVYCSFGVFHQLGVALLLIALTITVCVQAGRDARPYGNNASMAPRTHRLIIPLVLFISVLAAAPFFLLDYNTLGHVCTDPLLAFNRVLHVDEEGFETHLYTSALTIFTYVLPVIMMPLMLPIGLVRCCLRRGCCNERHKQSMGELAMTSLVDLVLVLSILAIIFPKIDEAYQLGTSLKLGPAPLLFELSNNALRPLIYLSMNPALRLGLRLMCCRNSASHNLVDDDSSDLQQPLSPVTNV